MGEVWLAEDTRLGRKVALKLLPAEFTENSDRVRRFTQEAKAASALNHPNIISVYDIGECETGRFIVMELVSGRTLRSVIASDNSLETFFALGHQMVRALGAAHAAGITHRDIKPDNIMVRDDGYVKVLDFGLARLLPTTASDPEAATLAQQTTPGTVMGTLAYMSPEQASGHTVGSASDVFALGIVLYELATGRHPFESETMIGYLHAITSQVPVPLTNVKSHLPAALDDLILRMLEKDAKGRPTASEVAQALQEIEKYGTSNTLSLRVVADKEKAAREGLGFRVAVLPFKFTGDAELATLADGISDEIVTGLSRFSYLRVIASSSTLRYASEASDVRRIGRQLGARYVLEGSIRKGGSSIRVSAQLVDTQTGAQLWAETYSRDLETSNIFAVQDDVAARIVATVADSYGVLVHSMRDAIRQKDDAELSPAEWQFQYFAYREQITPSNHAALKSRLELAAKSDKRPSDLWACLAQVYLDEYAFGFPGDDGTSLDRALGAARRAVELDRANQFALVALAQTHFFRQDLAAFHPAAERAMALNPLNTDAVGILGLQIVHTGQFERGTAIVRRAMELNANHAGWMHFAPLWDHFHKGEYEQALERANRVDVPGLFWPYLVMASACGHLGRSAEAEAAVRDLLALDPDFAAHARSNIASWHFASGLMEPLLEGLRKAGLSIPATDGSSDPARRNETVTPKAKRAEPATASGAIGGEEGFRVAVVPFKYGGADASLTALAEGLTEEIVTGLSRFSYLRVISRGSAADVQSAGKELGARYVMEGSLRQAGAKLRLAVQLVDATTGAHLWAENYERSFSPEAIFELQDDLVPRIVSTVADQYGALVHNMSESLRGRSAGEYSAHEAVLRAFGYWERVTREEHAEVREILEAAVAHSPGHSDCLAELSLIYWAEYAFGYNLKPDPLGRARAAAQRAVASAPTSHFAHHALATALFFQRDFQAFRSAADRALALNRMDASTAALLGQMIAYAGDWEYGLGVVDHAIQLNPHHPGWYHYLAFCDAYRRRDYPGALATALKVNMPGYHYPHVYLAAVYGQLGEQQRARAALKELQALVPNFGAVAREDFGKWLDPELTEHLLEGLRKAGLEIPDEAGASAAVAASDSGVARADEGFWVAVLPFKSSGNVAELAALAEGLPEDIVTGLSRFSYLRLIARTSTSGPAAGAADVRAAGKALGARYVMEGSVRQAGTRVRLAVQFIDTATGAHLWAETFDRAFHPKAAFELQDDLVPRIVATCGDRFGVLARSISDAVRGGEPGQLGPYEALMRGFGYHQRLTPVEHAEAREALEQAVDRAPSNADCWAMLSWIYSHEHAHGFNVRPGSLERALEAARRAVDIAPSNPLAQQTLAVVLFFRKETAGCLSAAERAIALNPLDTSNEAMFLIAFTGDWDRGCALIRRAMEWNPHHPRWYGLNLAINEYRLANYRAAVDETVKANAPDVFWT